MPSSKLFWNAELNQLEVDVTNSKKVTKRWVCPVEQLAPNVPRRVSETDNIEVDFDRDPQGNILRVRLKGKPWQGETKREQLDYQFIKAKAASDAEKSKSGQKHFSSGSKKDFHGNQEKKEEVKSEERLVDTNYSKEFHNPYNFVPAIPRDEVNQTDENGEVSDFGDKPPIGHDRFYDDFYTGKLTVEMTVKTPLVVPDTARTEVEGEHKKFPVRMENGKPFINPTAVKGMLRSAYEAVTNSRLAVFSKNNEERLAFRMDPKEALQIVPARIENGNIVLYTGTADISENSTASKGGGFN
jgi:hypothetical protein